MIADRDKQALLSLIQSPTWKVLESIAELRCTRTQAQERIADSEFATLKNAIQYDGEVRGIKGYLQEIIELAHSV